VQKRLKLRRSRWWVVSVCAAVGLGFLAVPSASAITSAQCDTQVNDTPSKLVACIQTADLWNHMQAFQAIANANPGPDGHPSRNSGEPGYKASADYVAGLMTQAGYDVTIQTYKFTYFAYTDLPVLSEVSPTAHDYGVTQEWNPGQSTGTANASLQPAGGIIIPPTATPSSSSGCTAADFSGFVPGRIALIQRGTCNFGVKVQNAQAAGASGVIIFNEGNPGRTDLFAGSLSDAAGNPIIPTIPVAFTSFGTGQDLYNQYQQAVQGNTALPVMNLAIKAIVKPNTDDYNVIADSKGGDPNHVVVVDAHLDAIYGAGMLDNASGSATILDIAQMMKNVNPRNKLRFIWFGGEELGLFGSAAYINSLSSNDLSHIGYDLDADVTATPNYTIGVLDPAAPNLFGGATPTFPNRVYKASTIARDQAIGYFNLFGGSLGNFEGNIGSFDGGCVDNPFRWCDNLSNNDPNVLTFMSKAFATMVVQMAFDTKVMSASNNAVYSKKLPIAAEAGRHFAAS
jgi:Peptidase family M28/PA domain